MGVSVFGVELLTALPGDCPGDTELEGDDANVVRFAASDFKRSKRLSASNSPQVDGRGALESSSEPDSGS